jgi:hypothetical protein
MLSPGNKEVKTTSSNPGQESPEMLWDIQAGKQDTKTFWEAVFISMLSVAQQIHIQMLSPEDKGALPCRPLQESYRSKKQSLTHIRLHASLLATLCSVLCDLPHTQIL